MTRMSVYIDTWISFFRRSDLIKWGTFIGGIATAFTVGVLAYQTTVLNDQTQILKTQFEEKDRPWIGLEAFSDEGDKIQFGYTNFGAIPDNNGTMLLLHSSTPLTRHDLESSEKIGVPIGSLIPNEHRAHFFTDLSISDVQNAKSGTSSLYLGILIKYNYENDKHGEFGTLVEYDNSTFTNSDNWVK